VAAGYMETTNSLTSGSNEFTDTVVAGNAAFGDLRLTAAWRQFKFTTSKQTNTLVGAIYSIGASDIKASIIRGNLSGRVGATSIDANDATQVGLGYVYNLSRRSALYATYSRIGNEGNATFVIPGGPALIAGNTSTGYEAGFRHNF
jgi:predicted porin